MRFKQSFGTTPRMPISYPSMSINVRLLTDNEFYTQIFS